MRSGAASVGGAGNPSLFHLTPVWVKSPSGRICRLACGPCSSIQPIIADELFLASVAPERELVLFDGMDAEFRGFAAANPFGPHVSDQAIGEKAKLEQACRSRFPHWTFSIRIRPWRALHDSCPHGRSARKAPRGEDRRTLMVSARDGFEFGDEHPGAPHTSHR